MRLFLFSIISLYPMLTFGAPCTEATINVPDGDASPNTYDCDSLTVNFPGITRNDGSTDPLIINVTGNVTISSNINLNGLAGGDDIGAFSSGGLGGPGASIGGGFDGATTEPGGVGSTTPPDGKSAAADNPCASGGGGAGFSVAGVSGKECATSVAPANGGDAATTTEFQFSLAVGAFRGGFGGAAGGLNTPTSTPGAGGGGGGGLIINASGLIRIDSGVTISAIGGSGGNDTDGDGAGGGGSGGAIWLIGNAGIVNNGTVNVSGGSGGTSSSGGNGGAGRSGRYRFESAGTVSEGTGISTPASRSTSSSSRKLSSDISCGTLSKNSDQKNNFFMMFLGFGFISLLSSIRRFKKVRAY